MDQTQIDAARKLADEVRNTLPELADVDGLADAVDQLAAALEQAQAERDEMMDILGIGPAEDQRPRIATLEAERDAATVVLGKLVKAVARDLIYSNDDGDEDKAWDALKALKECLEEAQHLLSEVPARAALHPEAGSE